MNEKELTPLEALEEAKNRKGLPLNVNFAPITESEIDIIEKELKEYESHKTFIDNAKNGLIVFVPRDTWEEERKKLKRLKELEKAFDTLSKEDEKAKKELSKEIENNKALVTIVQIFDIKVEKNKLGQCFVSSTNNLFAISQETYDLLKRCCYDIRND